MNRISLFLLLLCSLVSCRTSHLPSTPGTDDQKIEVVFLQMNDVYEIAPIEGGKVGGLARVATLKKQLLQKYPNTFAVMAGDFLNPSVIGTLKYEGSRINGKQMVEVLNVLGTDVVTFGNHEFDLKEEELLKRLQESNSQWVVANVFHKTSKGNQAFTSGPNQLPIPKALVLHAKDADGTSINIGVLGLTIPSNPADYVQYENYLTTARPVYDSLKNHVDLVIAVTHLAVKDDKELSKQLPGIRLIMGGHEHDHQIHQVGESIVAKADANAKTVYIHTLTYDKATKKLSIQSKLTAIDTTISSDPATELVVKKWTTIADNSFREQGFDPNQILTVAKEPLDGREETIRHRPSALSKLIAEAMSAAAPQSDLSILNTGSIRIDDQLVGNITQYDLIRTLPFGGKIVEADIRGDVLERILNIGLANVSSGGYLQSDKAVFDSTTKAWTISGKSISTSKTYRVALTDFLLTGKEANLSFLNPTTPGIKVYDTKYYPASDPKNDIRLAVVAFLRRNNPSMK